MAAETQTAPAAQVPSWEQAPSQAPVPSWEATTAPIAKAKPSWESGAAPDGPSWAKPVEKEGVPKNLFEEGMTPQKPTSTLGEIYNNPIFGGKKESELNSIDFEGMKLGEKVKVPINNGEDTVDVMKVGDDAFSYDKDAVPDAPEPKSSFAGAAMRTMLTQEPNTMAGAAASGLMNAAVSAIPFGKEAGPIARFAIGAGKYAMDIGAFMGGAAAREKLGHKYGEDNPVLQRDLAQQPAATTLGSVMSQYPTFGFGSAGGSIGKRILGRALPGAAAGTLQAGQEMMAAPQGQIMGQGGWTRTGLAAAGGAAFSKPSMLGEQLMGINPHPIIDAVDAASKKTDPFEANAKSNELQGISLAGEPPATNELPDIAHPDVPEPTAVPKPPVPFAKKTPEATAMQAQIEKTLGLGEERSNELIGEHNSEIAKAMDAADAAKLEMVKRLGTNIAPPETVTQPAEDTLLAKRLVGEGFSAMGKPDNPKTGPLLKELEGQEVTYHGYKGQLARSDDGAYVVIQGVRQAGSPVREIEISGASKDGTNPIKDIGVTTGKNYQSGQINPLVLAHLGAPVVGGAIGSLYGDTKEERAKNAVLGALIGLGGSLSTHALVEVAHNNPEMFNQIRETAEKMYGAGSGDVLNDIYAKSTLPEPSKEQPNAIQVKGSSPMDVRPSPGNGQGVGIQNPVGEGTPGKGIPVPKEPAQRVEVSENKRLTPEYREDVVGNILKSYDRAIGAGGVDVEAQNGIRKMMADRTGLDEDQFKSLVKSELPITTLEALENDMKQAEYIGRMGVYERKVAQAAEVAGHLTDMRGSEAEAMNTSKLIPNEGERQTLDEFASEKAHNGMMRMINTFGKERFMLTRDAFMGMMDGGKENGFIARIFGGKIDAAYQRREALKAEWKKPFLDIIKRNKLDDTSMERINIWMEGQQAGGLDRLSESAAKPRVVSDILKNGLDKGEQEYVGAARKFLDEKSFPAFKAFMRNQFNVELAHVDNYNPRQRDYEHYVSQPEAQQANVTPGSQMGMEKIKTALSEDFAGKSLTTQADKSASIERLPGAKGGVRLNEAKVLDDHMNALAHLMTHQHDLTVLDQIANHPEFQSKYGDVGQRWILNQLDTIARDGSPAGSRRSKALDYFTRGLSPVILGWRIVSQVKHLPNIAMGIAEVGWEHMANGLLQASTKEGRDWIAKNAIEIMQRFGGEQSIQEILNRGNSKWARFQKASFYPERIIDAAIARATVIGAYSKILEAKGIPLDHALEAPLDQAALREALVTSRKVVTSPLLKDIPQVLSRGTMFKGNMSYTKAMFQFQSTMLRQYSYLRHDLMEKGVRNMDPDQFIKASLGFMAMLGGETLIVQGQRHFIGNPDKKGPDNTFWQDAALEAAKRVPMAGIGVSLYHDFNTSGDISQTGLPVVDSALNSFKAGHDLYKGTHDYGKFTQPLTPHQRRAAWGQALTPAAALIGAPGVSTATQAYTNQPAWMMKGLKWADKNVVPDSLKPASLPEPR